MKMKKTATLTQATARRKNGCRISPKLPNHPGHVDAAAIGLHFRLLTADLAGRSDLFGIAAGTAAVMIPGTELCREKDVKRIFDRLTGNHEADLEHKQRLSPADFQESVTKKKVRQSR